MSYRIINDTTGQVLILDQADIDFIEENLVDEWIPEQIEDYLEEQLDEEVVKWTIRQRDWHKLLENV